MPFSYAETLLWEASAMILVDFDSLRNPYRKIFNLH